MQIPLEEKTDKGNTRLTILHILTDGFEEVSTQIIGAQSKEHQVEVIDLSRKDVAYEAVVDKIFSSDKVICW